MILYSHLSMGKGIAIKPSSDTIIAPFEATVESLFPTGHAIGLKSKMVQIAYPYHRYRETRRIRF